MAARPRKRFGQHWLKSESILRQIVAAAELTDCDRILEIGPGTGTLTRPLLATAAAVVAVEIDRDLHHQLSQTFAGQTHLHLIQGDFLDLDLEATLSSLPGVQSPNKVVANIPYYITGPILEKLLGSISVPNPAPFDSIVLLVQKEVADRLCAVPGTRVCGALTIRVQYLATCELVCPVPAKAFHPAPKVDSAVVRLRPRPLVIGAEDARWLDQLVKLGFSSKRKMLRNNLSSVVDRDRTTDILAALNLNPQVRAEDLSVEQWVALSNKMLKDRLADMPPNA